MKAEELLQRIQQTLKREEKKIAEIYQELQELENTKMIEIESTIEEIEEKIKKMENKQ